VIPTTTIPLNSIDQIRLAVTNANEVRIGLYDTIKERIGDFLIMGNAKNQYSQFSQFGLEKIKIELISSFFHFTWDDYVYLNRKSRISMDSIGDFKAEINSDILTFEIKKQDKEKPLRLGYNHSVIDYQLLKNFLDMLNLYKEMKLYFGGVDLPVVILLLNNVNSLLGRIMLQEKDEPTISEELTTADRTTDSYPEESSFPAEADRENQSFPFIEHDSPTLKQSIDANSLHSKETSSTDPGTEESWLSKEYGKLQKFSNHSPKYGESNSDLNKFTPFSDDEVESMVKQIKKGGLKNEEKSEDEWQMGKKGSDANRMGLSIGKRKEGYQHTKSSPNLMRETSVSSLLSSAAVATIKKAKSLSHLTGKTFSSKHLGNKSHKPER
jgi:hypothetical protein